MGECPASQLSLKDQGFHIPMPKTAPFQEKGKHIY